MTLEYSSSTGDSMTTGDMKMMWLTIYTRTDGNTQNEEPSKIEEYEPQRVGQNKNKGNIAKILIIIASLVSQVLLNVGIASQIIAIDRIRVGDT